MAYTPPNCDAIEFNFSGTYITPDCDNISWDFGGLIPPDILSESVDLYLDLQDHTIVDAQFISSENVFINFDISNSEIDPLIDIVSENIDLPIYIDDSSIEILPDIISEVVDIIYQLEDSVIKTPEAHHLPNGTSAPRLSVAWNSNADIVDVSSTMPWGTSSIIDNIITNPFSPAEVVDVTLSTPWKMMKKRDRITSIPFRMFETFDKRVSTSWNMMTPSDLQTSIVWAEAEKVDSKTNIVYKHPGKNDITINTPWTDSPEHLDKYQQIPWGEPGAKDRRINICWGPYSYYKLCFLGDKYTPPNPEGPIEFHFPNKYDLIENACSDITFYMNNYASVQDDRCPWEHHHTGRRDTHLPFTLPKIQFPVPKKVYYMFNTILVKELTTNHPIEVLGVSITTDRSSWLYQFQITVASKDCLEMIMPSNGVFATLHINVNGWEFLCTVEGWSENRRFGDDAWTITGRSHSLMFGNPISLKASGTETTGYQGEQLVNNIVQGKNVPSGWPLALENWTVDWTVYTSGSTSTGFLPSSQWYIPPNTLSYSDKTEIEVIKDIIGGIGAFIQTDTSQNEFIVKPMYAHQPWEWTSDNSNIEYSPIIEDQFDEVSRSYEYRPEYHGVHVMGENQGGNNDGSVGTPAGTVFVDVRRQECGPSAATYSSMVSHPFVTSTKAALELGRAVIGSSGEWVNHSLRLATLCPPGSTSMGLFRPGDMLTILERGVQWQCQVVGVTLAGVNNGNGFTVEQTLQVEQYKGGTPNC